MIERKYIEMFVQNLKQKYENKDFRQDIRILLPVDTEYDFGVAYEYVVENVIPLI